MKLYFAASLAMLAGAMTTAPAWGQQPWEVRQHISEAYGTYQCGPELVTVDSSWQVSSRVYDGIHYYVARGMPDGRFFVLGFPARGSGLDEMYASNRAPRYTLTIFQIESNANEDHFWTCDRR